MYETQTDRGERVQTKSNGDDAQWIIQPINIVQARSAVARISDSLKEMFDNLCRLCGGTEDLLWIFDEKISDANMTEIISVTSGVEITRTDLITQMVCSQCCQITIKMYTFRTTAIKNDKDLKARCAGYNISRLTLATNIKREANAAILRPLNSPAPKSPLAEPVTNTKLNSLESSNNSHTNSNIISPVLVPIVKKDPARKPTSVHPSIREIKRKYPNIKLPQMSLRSHVGVYITLLRDEVEDWYKERKFSADQIEKFKNEAAEYCSSTKDCLSISKKGESGAIDSEFEASKPNESRNFVISSTNNYKRLKLNNEITAKDINRASVKSNSKRNSKSDSVVESSRSSANAKLIDAPQTTTTTGSNPAAISGSNIDGLLDGGSDADVGADFTIDADHDNGTDHESENAALKSSTFRTRSKTIKTADITVSIPKVTSAMKKPKSVANSSVKTKVRKMVTDKDQRKLKKIERGKLSTLRDGEHHKTVKNQKKSNGAVATLKRNSKSSNSPNKKSLGGTAKINSKEKDQLEGDSLIIYEKVVTPPTVPAIEDDSNMFTTRSFLENAEQPSSKYKVHTELDGRIVLMLPDSDEDEAPRNTYSNSEDRVLLIDTAASSTSVQSSVSIAADNSNPKSPNSQTTSNMPDFTLVSFKEKIQRLHTCKVCDSQHPTLKDLKHHQRRRHTRCPFCNKKFRNLAVRDDHVKYNCNIKSKPPELKNFKLCLVRVDEEEDIRRQFSAAFEQKDCEITSANVAEFAKEVHVGTMEDQEQEADAVEEFEKELEEFLRCAESISGSSGQIGNRKKPMSTESAADVICISDGKSDNKKRRLENVQTSKPKINIVNSDILKNINFLDSDVNVLKSILNDEKIRAMLGDGSTLTSLNSMAIMEGSTGKVKIFKNLRKYLHQYKIPIEITYNPTVAVMYKPTPMPLAKRMNDLWHNMVPQKLLPLSKVSGTSTTPDQNAPTIPSHPLDNDQNCNIPPTNNEVINTGKEETYADNSMLINGTQSTCSSATTNGDTNILGGSLMQAKALNLPSTQGPLPIIQSVSSVPEAQNSRNGEVEDQIVSNATVTQSLVTNAIVPVSNTLASVGSSMSNALAPITDELFSIPSSLGNALEPANNAVSSISTTIAPVSNGIMSVDSSGLIPVSNGLVSVNSSVNNAPVRNRLVSAQSPVSSSVICASSYGNAAMCMDKIISDAVDSLFQPQPVIDVLLPTSSTINCLELATSACMPVELDVHKPTGYMDNGLSPAIRIKNFEELS